MILKEVKTEDKRINILKLSEIVDMYSYIPIKIKTHKNASSGLHDVLNSTIDVSSMKNEN